MNAICKRMLAVFTIITAASLIFGQPAFSDEKDGVIIKIETDKTCPSPSLKISPDELSVAAGVIVIWLNTIANQDINIVFKDGTHAEPAVTDSMGFVSGKDRTFAAKYIPFIATVSLRFIKEGSYPYSVELKNGSCISNGVIRVNPPPAHR